MEILRRRHSKLPHVACFDTMRIRRYGFHGLSYAYIMEKLTRVAGTKAGRVVLAHLGTGVSMAAVLEGKSIDTSMASLLLPG